MNQITVIYGAQGTGKTLKAQTLAKGKKTLWTNEKRTSKDLTKKLTSEIQLIIIDEVVTRGFARGVANTISAKFVKPDTIKGGVYMLEIDLPDIIIITQVLNEVDFKDINRNIVFYDMSKEAPF